MPLEAIKINETTYRIEDNMVRAFLFIGKDKSMLVDTGFGASGSIKAIVETLTDAPVMLVNTHADPDHIGNNQEFAAAYMHPAEMAYYGLNAKQNAQVSPLWDGDIIDLGDRAFEVIHIPGHTPGSIALLDRENRILVAGDSIAGTVFMFGEIRCLRAYLASMERLAKITDTFDTIYPSHGPFPVPSATTNKALSATKKMLAGELPPEDPPFPIPAKMYLHDGVGFFY